MTGRSGGRQPNGSGSVYRRADGRWAGALYVNEADGRRVRRQVYGRTRKEVETKVVELRSKADAGAAMTPSHLTLEAFLNEWLS
jgi:integrase